MSSLTPFHGGDRGSNPLGDANYINGLSDRIQLLPDILSKIWPISTLGRRRTQPCYTLSPGGLPDLRRGYHLENRTAWLRRGEALSRRPAAIAVWGEHPSEQGKAQ